MGDNTRRYGSMTVSGVLTFLLVAGVLLQGTMNAAAATVSESFENPWGGLTPGGSGSNTDNLVGTGLPSGQQFPSRSGAFSLGLRIESCGTPPCGVWMKKRITIDPPGGGSPQGPLFACDQVQNCLQVYIRHFNGAGDTWKCIYYFGTTEPTSLSQFTVCGGYLGSVGTSGWSYMQFYGAVDAPYWFAWGVEATSAGSKIYYFDDLAVYKWGTVVYSNNFDSSFGGWQPDYSSSAGCSGYDFSFSISKKYANPYSGTYGVGFWYKVTTVNQFCFAAWLEKSFSGAAGGNAQLDVRWKTYGDEAYPRVVKAYMWNINPEVVSDIDGPSYSRFIGFCDEPQPAQYGLKTGSINFAPSGTLWFALAQVAGNPTGSGGDTHYFDVLTVTY